MPVMYNTGDWFTLRPGCVYRKIEFYNFDWPQEANLEYMNVYGAPYGGPIAVVRDPRQIAPVRGTAKPVIRIFNSVGSLISKISWNHGIIVTLGWSDTEDLLCVQNDGLVVIYDMFGNYKHTFSMGEVPSVTKVIDARVFASSVGTGVAVMTSTFRVFLVNNINEPKNRELPETRRNPTWWEIVTEGRNTFALVALEKQIARLDQDENVCIMQNCIIDKPFTSIIRMSVSYNQRYLAVYTNNGIVWMGTTDMKSKLCEFDTGRSVEPPRQIEWCLDSENCRQSDALIITYSSLLLVINTSGDINMYTYDPAIFLIPEMDGVRVLTNTCHELIQRVPTCVQNIFAINSQEPSSFLFEAHKKFQEKSHQSDEYLGLFKDKIDIAVNECLEAACYEFDTETQKSLIKAAYFGKGFLPSHNPDEYIKICRILRVLNALRHRRVGLPITYKQFCHLKPNVILDRLVFRKHYAIAIQIAKHLKLSESKILEHWAFHKVLYDKSDDEVARKITEKFKNPTVQGVSFCNIAQKAHDVGRDKLAIKLLELEPKAILQVPLLLKLKENNKALLSATRSGDTDLVYTVLLNIKESADVKNFQMIIHDFPMAQNLYKKYCLMYSPATLHEINNVEDDWCGQAELFLREGIEKNSVENFLLSTSTMYSRAHKDVEVELCNEVRKVLQEQQRLSHKHQDVNFVGLSIHDTVMALLTKGDIKLAEKFKSEYKIPDKRFWWLRIQVLSEQFCWAELEKFSKAKKSPIGYEPFVEVCLKQGNTEEAKKYLPKCRDDRKIKLYIRAGLTEEAADAAFEQKDIQSLWTIHMHVSRRNDQQLIGKTENYIAQLTTRK